jgi:hypothetical protein
MASFDDALCCVYADMVGESKKVQNYADVIHGWSLSKKKSCFLGLPNVMIWVEIVFEVEA